MEDTAQVLHNLIHHLSAVYARDCDQILLEQFGLGFSQFKIMNSIAENPALRQKHIAFELGQTEASISRQVKLLQEQGMLTVRRNPANLREHRVELTFKGEQMIEAARESLQIHQIKSLAHVPGKQQTQLLELLTRLSV